MFDALKRINLDNKTFLFFNVIYYINLQILMVQNNIEKIKDVMIIGSQSSDIFCYNELKANLFQCNLILPKSLCDNVCLNIAIFSKAFAWNRFTFQYSLSLNVRNNRICNTGLWMICWVTFNEKNDHILKIWFNFRSDLKCIS